MSIEEKGGGVQVRDVSDDLPPGAGGTPQFASIAGLTAEYGVIIAEIGAPRRPAASPLHHSGLMAAITVPVGPGLATEYSPGGGK